jgi:RNA polymerase sigma-70 factor (ECF subfamily)
MVSRMRFEELVLPHMQAAFNLAYWILGERAEAEDVVQDAFLRAFRAFGGFRGENAKPWLLAIVRNAAFRAIQNRKRSARFFILSRDVKGSDGQVVAEMASDDPSAESVLLAAEDRERLHAALGSLPIDYREIIVLRELEGLSYSEISEAVAIPIGTVMSRLSRARAELRVLLAQRKE